MADDINEQLKERRAREEARREKMQTGNEADDAKTELSEQKDSNSNSNSRVSELQKSLNEKYNKLQDLEKQTRQLQQQYQQLFFDFQRERQELNQFGGAFDIPNPNPIPIPSPTSTNNAQGSSANVPETVNTSVDTNINPSANANANANNSAQIMTDEELARHLQAQFAREEEVEEEAAVFTRSSNVPESGIRSFTYGDPTSGNGFSFQISSTGAPATSIGNFPMFGGLTSLFDHDEMFTSPFLTGGANLGRLINRNTNNGDPFSRMRMSPISTFPGLMFGGALMPENMDYETLMRLFPPVPRGATQQDIQQLPVDTFRSKPQDKDEKDEKDQKDQKDQKEKEKDEFHKCCICLENFKDGDEIRRLPCLHIFHADEISHWLERNHLCPICRTPIEQNEPAIEPDLNQSNPLNPPNQTNESN